ncbi:ribonuclease domain-containing protein [Streptomyces sp. NPDC088194]|uniref:ribonuclease domain-containing protein n=1 Tax=Streptomyces sp. NPDC088194 TaxID=3154931 RepID=UPI00344DE9F7
MRTGVSPTSRGSAGRRAARWLAVAPFAAVLAVSALPAAAAPALPAPSRAAALAPADVLQPPLPLEDFPAQVAQACAIWEGLGWPGTPKPTDYRTLDGQYIRGGNPYGNRSGDLPHEDTYREYDVNPRPTPTTHRDAERIVRDQATHQVWYSDDHYSNFREIRGGC